MSEQASDPSQETAPERAARLRRAAELLGDLEPGSTRDDTDRGWGEAPDMTQAARDAELRRNVPPHHG